MNRRQFLLASGATLASAAFAKAAAPATASTRASTRPSLNWTDALTLTIDARPYTDTLSPYDRLPARAKSIVRPAVWNLSRDSVGLAVRFTSDARALHVRYTLTRPNLAMYHMPASGVSGVDLYAHVDDHWQWLAISRPVAQTVEGRLIGELPPGSRDYTLYLPLYNGVKSLAIGTPAGAAIKPWPRTTNTHPILYYGTSIAQGACASRAGMAYTNILSRRLDRPVINEGFSGNGTMDHELAPLFAEVDAAAYVIDTLPNMTPESVKRRTEPFVRALREKRPETPVLLVEDRTFGSAPLQPVMQRLHAERRANLRAAYEHLAKDDPHLSYLEGDTLLGSDSEATTDGSHPNDLGMVRYADALEPVLRKMLS